MNFLKTLLTACVVALIAGAASAATVTTTGGGATFQCELENFTVSIACNGGFDPENNGGNVEASDLDALFFADGEAIGPWMEVDRVGSVGNGSNTGANDFFEVDSDGTTGEWRLVDGVMFDENYFYAFVVKGSTDQAAYVMDISSYSGDWATLDLLNNGDNNPALSNIGLFKAAGNMTPIPLPAAGWLLLGGLGGLAAMKRRRKS